MHVGGMMIHVMRAIILVCISYAGLYLVQFSKAEEKILYPSACRSMVDDIFSEKTRQDISLFVHKTYDSKNSMQSFLESVQSHFPVVQSISVSLDNADSMNIVIRGHRPYLLINEDAATTLDGVMFSRKSFSEASLQGLRHVDCSHQVISDRLEASALTFLKKIPEHMFHDYSIRWESCDAIWFDHKEKQRSVLVASDWNVNSDDLYSCEKIQENSVESKKKKKQKTRLVCDLRFKGQVVVRQILQ